MRLTGTPPRFKEGEKWSLAKLPPEGHPDVGPFFQGLFQAAFNARDEEGLAERWVQNYRLFKGNHRQGKSKKRISLALMQGAINKSVATVSAGPPVVEIAPRDGELSKIEAWLNVRVQEWLRSAPVLAAQKAAAQNMEVYGTGIEKYTWDAVRGCCRITTVDPFSFFPAPKEKGPLDQLSYVCHCYMKSSGEIENLFGKKVGHEDDHVEILGEARFNVRAIGHTAASVSQYPTGYTDTSVENGHHERRLLVCEIWVRDNATVDVDDPEQPIYASEDEVKKMVDEAEDTETALSIAEQLQAGQMPVKKFGKKKVAKYPGGIRKVTITAFGRMVLDDVPNPSINSELLAVEPDFVKTSYFFDRFPFTKAVSFSDTDSFWGFSSAELVYDIALAIDDIWTSLSLYLQMCLQPPLILPLDTKIPRNKIRWEPRLLLQPVSSATGGGIKWLDMPAPPQWVLQVVDALVKFFDRIAGVEDLNAASANSTGVIAASAISAIHERGSLAFANKIESIDQLSRFRAEAFISLMQNFDMEPTSISIGKDLSGAVVDLTFRGVDLSAKDFDVTVESGSTVARPTGEREAQALQLFQVQGIDRQALLEAVRFPNAAEVLERMGETELDAALGVLVAAGFPPEAGAILKAILAQAQQGPMAQPVPPEALIQLAQALVGPMLAAQAMAAPVAPGQPGQPPAAPGQPGQPPVAKPSGPAKAGNAARGKEGGQPSHRGPGAYVANQPGAPAKPGIPKAAQGKR